MYQALYRKYRPRTFDDVVGQEAITRTLKNQVVQDRLSHAYLFTGTRGTGKTSCAKILAKAVNCLHPVDGNPCNQCEACRSIDSGACLDVLEIDAASNNGVDNVRVLRDDAIYAPSEVKKRVYIIDEVHMLSMAAFNALLKIVEEPPEHLIFILATTELHKVPATILSRCQRFSFRRLGPEDIAGRLNFAAYEEGIAIEPEALRLLARLADGALRDGLSLLDQCASGTEGTVTVQSIYDSLGLAGQQRTVELLRAVAGRDGAGALSLLAQLYDQGKDLSALLDELSSAARDLLLLKTAPAGAEAMLSGVCQLEELKGLLPAFPAAELLRMVTALQNGQAGLKGGGSSRIAAELCVIELCDPALRLDAEALSARLSRLEQAVQSGAALVAAPEKVEPAETSPPSAVPEKKAEPAGPAAESSPGDSLPVGFWADLVARLQPELPPKAKGFFSQEGPIRAGLHDGVLVLTADSPFVKQMASEPEIVELVAQAAAGLLGRQAAVNVTLKGKEQESGNWQELLAFGNAHQDVITLKE